MVSQIQTNRMDMKIGSIILLHPRSTPQRQGQTSPQNKGWKKIFEANGPKKQAGAASLIANKIDFKPKTIKRHYILTKEKNLPI